MKTFLPAILLIGAVVAVFYFARGINPTTNEPVSSNSATPAAAPSVAGQVATIELEKGGIIKFKLLPNIAPKTVANFTAKANAGAYDNLTFHRVEDWVLQGGDPLGKGTGGGDQPTELSAEPFKVGAVGIARGGDINISNDMQFFILKKDSQFLDNQYTNFGQVFEGQDVVNSTQIGDKIRRIRVQ